MDAFLASRGPKIGALAQQIVAMMQRACIEEELAQGLGLANDSPYARPSIFNDDDEFATLTSMDAVMLQILYNPRLLPGMTLDQARPFDLYEISELGRRFRA